jgi:GTP-binding protein
VDLPGYGYAKVSKKIRAQWQPMVEQYLSLRNNLLGLILLIDIRRDPKKEEFDLMEWLETHKMPYLVILTKSDKLSKTKQKKRFSSICSQLKRDENGIILFSTKTKKGRDTILDEIDKLIEWHDE